MDDNVFPKGMMLKPKREGAPEFVLGSISIKVDEFIAWAKANEKADGWINLDVLKSKEGKNYLKLNDWQPKKDF
jgi:hypothetical protein